MILRQQIKTALFSLMMILSHILFLSDVAFSQNVPVYIETINETTFIETLDENPPTLIETVDASDLVGEMIVQLDVEVVDELATDTSMPVSQPDTDQLLKNQADKNYDYSPRIGLNLGSSAAMGVLGQILNPGMDIRIKTDIVLPIEITDSIETRAGFFIGSSSYQSKIDRLDVTLTVIPMIFYTEISYKSKSGYRPYASIGGGMSQLTLAGKNTNTGKSLEGSSMDFSISTGAGLGYLFDSIPLDIVLDINYLIAFEKMSGHFLSTSFGMSYRFGSSN